MQKPDRVRLAKFRLAAALPTAIMLVALLFVIAVSYLDTMTADTHFNLLLERDGRSYYLARAGLEYYMSTNYLTLGTAEPIPNPIPPPYPWVGEIVYPNPADPTQYFQLTLKTPVVVYDRYGVQQNWDMIVSTGVVCDKSGNILNQHSLMSPKVGDKFSFQMVAGANGQVAGFGNVIYDTDGLDRGRLTNLYDLSLEGN